MPHRNTANTFKKRYESGELKEFYRLTPHDYQGALQTKRTFDRALLAKVLKAYAQNLNAPSAVFRSLEQLTNSNSRAVVTGQQVGLLLGPTYTLSKAISAIKLARKLSTDSKPVVPIFWLASQDHDSAEINHTYLLDMNERLTRLDIPLPEGMAVGRIKLESHWLDQIIDKILSLNFPHTYRKEVVSLLQETAESAQNIADWFAALFYRLLGDEGLIVINPLDVTTAALFKGLIKKELHNPLASSKLINEAGDKLKAFSIEPQLGRSEGASNLFFEEADGKRQLLHFRNKSFHSLINSYKLNDLLDILEENPSRLTPAAGLRPVAQDYLLPTAVMVVGPGELRYIAQLKGVYELHGMEMPLIQLRMTITVLEPPVKRIMNKFDLTSSELAKDFLGAREEVLLKISGHGKDFEKQLGNLEAGMKEMFKDIEAIDPTLKPVIIRSKKRLRRTLENLKHKTADKLLKKDSLTKSQFERLKVQLFPNDIPQERLLSPCSFFLKFGIDNILNTFLELPCEGNHEVCI